MKVKYYFFISILLVLTLQPMAYSEENNTEITFQIIEIEENEVEIFKELTNYYVFIIILLVLLGIIIYYRSFCVGGLLKRAQSMHKKADKLSREGLHNKSSVLRKKARKLQKRADNRRY